MTLAAITLLLFPCLVHTKAASLWYLVQKCQKVGVELFARPEGDGEDELFEEGEGRARRARQRLHPLASTKWGRLERLLSVDFTLSLPHFVEARASPFSRPKGD
jgi:hypothetical protein